MGELVALETQNPSSELNNSEEDCVDFVAATTATLGVPSPSLSKRKSFDDPLQINERKGDLEEENELLRALKLSETGNSPTKVEENDVNGAIKNAKSEEDLITFETDPMQDVCSSSQGDNDKHHEKIETPSEQHDGKDETVDLLVESEKPTEGLDESDLLPPVNTLVHNSGEFVQAQPIDEATSLTANADESEPVYEGEEHIQETSTANYQNREPMYEGEVVLAEQVDKVISSTHETKGNDVITQKQGEVIRNFMKNSASQLTIYGLFSLQEGLKEREICVFFRNNHFNTMFKFEGELYILATDQGYINQPDLVWEKLNEVNGDTVYMTGSFKEFNAENPETPSWDEQNASANTVEYLASIDNAAQENTDFNSDLQLAIALQQQEFEQQEQQPPPQQQRNLPQPNTSGESGLVTGPQHVQPSRPRKQESKSSKEKCIVM